MVEFNDPTEKKRQYTNKYMFPVMVFGLALISWGCATKGVQFSPVNVNTIPPDKALVYFYREKQFLGRDLIYRVWVNRGSVADLTTGSYCTYFASPGPLAVDTRLVTLLPDHIHSEALNNLNTLSMLVGLGDFVVRKERLINFEVKAGETYYVRTKTGWPGFHGELVGKGVAMGKMPKYKRAAPALNKEK